MPSDRVMLVRYDAACKALAAARSTDEVLKIRGASSAMKAYAKQAKNRQLELDAIEIRTRAERRCGELMEAQRASEGLNKGGAERGIGRRGNAGRKGTRIDKPTLAAAGIDKSLADRARKAAKLPAAEFEHRIAAWRDASLNGAPIADPITPRASIHHSSETPEHYTPRNVLDRVLACFGSIDLDPCSNPGIPNVPAARRFTAADDGLAQPWDATTLFLNPPYGREIDAWIEKLCAEHARQPGGVVEAIALVPARTDTEWFRRLREYVRCEVAGRLTFVGNADPAPFPSALFYLGDDIGKFYRAFVDLGDIWQLLNPDMFGE